MKVDEKYMAHTPFETLIGMVKCTREEGLANSITKFDIGEGGSQRNLSLAN